MADKTEKATPKRAQEARKKGQVARSMDLNGAVVLFAGLVALGAAGPSIVAHLQEQLAWALTLGAHPEVISQEVISQEGIGQVLLQALTHTALAVAPLFGASVLAAVAVNLVQVGFKPSLHALKPDPKRINPVSGFKNIFGPNAAVEGGKSVLKMLAVGVIVAMALVPQIDEMGAMVGMEPSMLAGQLASTVLAIAKRAAIAYFAIGILDYAWQRFRHQKSMKMDKEEVKDEAKQQTLPAEVRQQIRRRQVAASRARMMADVPTADVVVTNPTHYAVALRYDGQSAAPQVVAKGADLLAARIREVAREHDVPLVPDPPLARSLHASVEVGQQIPEELFGAVAQVLAFVYRMAGRRVAA